jgi:hypothetical protein
MDSRLRRVRFTPGKADEVGRFLIDLPRKFPVIRLEFPVLRKNFPDSLLREFAEKSPQHSGFMLENCRL